VVLVEEVSTQRVQMGLFIFLEKDLGLAKILRESCLFDKKDRVYVTEILRNVRVSALRYQKLSPVIATFSPGLLNLYVQKP